MADQRSQLYFEDVQPGDALPIREYGPLTIVDTVRWAGLQENTARLHYDRDWARQRGLTSFIASGQYRQALLMRMLTDWIGPRGVLRKLSLRHIYSTFEGDMMRYSGRVIEKSIDPEGPSIVCELEGKNQDERPILTGRCTLSLAQRSAGNILLK
jgi:acyl dehydratase